MAEKPTVVECLSSAMELIRSVGKTGKNTHQNYSFRGIDATVNAASPAFRQVGVVVTPEVQSVHYETVEVGSKRSVMQACRVLVTYTFHGPAGDTITATVPGESMDSGDKATPKAMSVAFRIALLQALCIPTDEADPDETSYERSPARPPTPAPPKVPAGPVGVATAKQLLVQKCHTRGAVDKEAAEAMAAAIWIDAGNPDGPFDEDALHELLARAEGVAA